MDDKFGSSILALHLSDGVEALLLLNLSDGLVVDLDKEMSRFVFFCEEQVVGLMYDGAIDVLFFLSSILDKINERKSC